jgi:hypothetical protein
MIAVSWESQLKTVKMDLVPDIEQVLREKKLFTLRCMLDGIQEL